MRRLLTLVFLLCLAIPAGISFSGCTRNPAGNYCNGEGFGLKLTDVASIDLEPRTTGYSLFFGQTQQLSAPQAKSCKGNNLSVTSWTYGTTNNQLVDISPTGVLCAGTWNRRTGGGIADYTICQLPSPLPSTNNLPYASANVYASANGITSNLVVVYTHAQVTSLSLVLENSSTDPTPFLGCLSQTFTAQLDAQAYYNVAGSQALLCSPTPPVGQSNIPNCSTAIGNLTYTSQNSTIATINQTGVITAVQPGTTYITASVAGSGSSAGYFSTCPPASISLNLNGATSGTVTQGVTQNLTTTVIDTKGNTIQGLTLNYQSTNPLMISAGSNGAVTANYAGQAEIYAVCQPSTCNPSPIDKVGVNQTGVSVTSNPVLITTPGTASSYAWFSSPNSAPCPGATAASTLPPSTGSLYFNSVELINGQVNSPTKMPYVPNSMKMDRSGVSLYFGSCHELMVYSAATNSLTKEDPNVPGVVLAVAPNNQQILINDQARQIFYVYTTQSGTYSTFGGVGVSAQWTPDAQTLYIVGTDYSKSAAGVPTLFVDNVNTGWSTYVLAAQPDQLAITIPGIGAFLNGSTTTMHAWCPQVSLDQTGTTLLAAYPEVPTGALKGTDVLGATKDGAHIVGATKVSSSSANVYDFSLDFSDSLNNGACPSVTTGSTITSTNITNSPVTSDPNTALPIAPGVQLLALEQVVPSPSSDLSFVTYAATAGSTATATLPYYTPAANGPLGTTGFVSFVEPAGTTAVPTAPVAGAFSLDGTLFFVSTSGDNLLHYISIPALTDSQQINPGLVDSNGNPVPVTVIVTKPRQTT
jgi:trimeric autotransporter adhesin